ncbi:MAG: hypothetical protein QOF79_523 [Actinomycetota bacterium]|jgi:hypothetical protein|nr:hypothetical protein [Actinomycetota bacterium]
MRRPCGRLWTAFDDDLLHFRNGRRERSSSLIAMTDPQPAPVPAPTTPAGWYSDPASGRMRWWDGYRWTENFQTPVVATATASNGFATASLILGIAGFVLFAIPFVGWLIGGIPDLLAVVFGIVGLNNDAARRGNGKPLAIVGLVLGGVSLLSVFIGGGWLW